MVSVALLFGNIWAMELLGGEVKRFFPCCPLCPLAEPFPASHVPGAPTPG